MSLEIALAENTATMRELISLLKGGAIAPPAEEPKKTRKPRGEAPPESAAPESAAPIKMEVKAAERAPAIEEPKAPAIEYKQIADAITRLVAKDRARAVEILAGFGVKRGPDLKQEQWAEALEQLQAALQ